MSRAMRITLTAALVLTLGIASVLGAYSIVSAATGGPGASAYPSRRSRISRESPAISNGFVMRTVRGSPSVPHSSGV